MNGAFILRVLTTLKGLHMEMKVGSGEPAPQLEMSAAGSNREVGPQSSAGRPLVLVFHLQSTASAAREVNRAVRERYPSPEEVTVASVVDLGLVPPVYWMTVGIVLAQAYERASEELPEGSDPEDYVMILPDWGGVVSRRFGVRNTGRAAAVAVIDGEWNLAGTYQGQDPAGVVLELLG